MFDCFDSIINKNMFVKMVLKNLNFSGFGIIYLRFLIILFLLFLF